MLYKKDASKFDLMFLIKKIMVKNVIKHNHLIIVIRFYKAKNFYSLYL